jgi:7-carboxy-7-deazaguanine synthase
MTVYHVARTLPVNEVFETIQGEASNAGTPALFIRLQGCPVGCPWCDTKYTWDLDENDRATEVEAITEAPHTELWYHGEIDILVERAVRSRCPLVVITGGEPCLYDLTHLTGMLISKDKRVQIETSGTHEILCHPNTWVTVSPKIDMPGGFDVLASAMARADEVKMPVGRTADLVKLIRLLDERPKRDGVLIWLQPLSLSPKATELCVDQAIKQGWRVSLQAHALAGVR